MKIGEKIKLYREEKGINKSELARIIHVSPAYITKLEKGEKQNPSNEVILKIAAALKIDLKDLLSDTEIQERFKETSKINELLQRESFKNDFDINLFDTRVMKYINDLKNEIKNSFPGVDFNNTLVIQNTFIKIMAKQQAEKDCGMSTEKLLLEYAVSNGSFITGEELYNNLYESYLDKYKKDRKIMIGGIISTILKFGEDYECNKEEIGYIKEYFKDFPKNKIPKRFIKYFDSNEE